MLERLGASGFAEEPLERGRIFGQRGRQDLDRDFVAGLDVNRPEDGAHAARPEPLQESIAADVRADLIRRRTAMTIDLNRLTHIHGTPPPPPGR
jgi:hypothetical protein